MPTEPTIDPIGSDATDLREFEANRSFVEEAARLAPLEDLARVFITYQSRTR